MQRSKGDDDVTHRDEKRQAAERSRPSDAGEGGPAAPVPAIDPDAYESYEGFRETTLAIFTDPADNHALRRFGGLLSDLAWEFARHWPPAAGGIFRHQVRAAVADLRHVQGYLARLGREPLASELTADETGVARVCGRLAASVKGIADTLERELKPPEGTADSGS